MSGSPSRLASGPPETFEEKSSWCGSLAIEPLLDDADTIYALVVSVGKFYKPSPTFRRHLGAASETFRIHGEIKVSERV